MTRERKRRGGAMRGLLPVSHLTFLANLFGSFMWVNSSWAHSKSSAQFRFVSLSSLSHSFSAELFNLCLISLTSSCSFFCTLFSFLSEWRGVYFVYYYHDDNSVLRLYSLLFIMHYCYCFLLSLWARFACYANRFTQIYEPYLILLQFLSYFLLLPSNWWRAYCLAPFFRFSLFYCF